MTDPGALWLAAMRRGDLDAAWRISDAVLVARDPATRDDPRLPYHLRWVWDGRPFDGRRVLVRCYHGLGDTLQFARFLPALRRRVAALAVEAQPALLPVLAQIPGPDRLIPFRPAAPTPPAEVDLEIMELAHALRVREADLAASVPYLAAPEPLVRAARARIGPGFAVGLCWQVGDWAKDRAVPLPVLASALPPGLRLVSLQRGPAADDAQAPGAPDFVNPYDRSVDVLETAALLGAVDLVVTVDTMVAHLAGAMGRPVWLLLKHDADWRWMADRRDSPWYPTMRPYRQDRPGAWDAPLARLGAGLRRMAWAGGAFPAALTGSRC